MSHSATPPSADVVATRLAEAGWWPIQERLIRGLCHDLNGRLTALFAMEHLLEVGASLPTPFAHEISQLEAVARRLSELADSVDAPPAPSAPTPLVERALELHRRIKDPRGAATDARFADGLPAILVNDARQVRLLLLLLDLARSSSSAGVLELSGDADGIRVSVTVLEPPGATRVAALDRLAALDGGSVAFDAGRCVLALPSLARARAGSS